ncbi:Electron transfer flavoprotein, alpha subunit [hydrothermal vent metagenome]|uniref:Electron transfer flavoprotein, alpha subunit n=1 Tax=hydrothermal vent metagenome TaxID=652676 RepID=A0A3B0SGS9_9ZZZZ
MAGFLIIAEHINGQMREITGEMIGAAVKLNQKLNAPVCVVVIGAQAPALAKQINQAGVSDILAVKTASDHFSAELYEEIAVRVGTEMRPRAILVGHTISGMAYAAAIAARLGCGFAADVFALEMDNGDLVATRSAYGNKVNLELGFPGKACVTLTLRGATFAPPEGHRTAPIKMLEMDLSGLKRVATHVEYQEAPPSDIDISRAEFILSVGRGIQDQDNLPRFAELSKRLGATFGCSRPIVDAGWLAKPHQVGQSGKVASNCKLYIALGISGAVQHQFGMKHVDTIIAINTDPDAPIFNVATYGATIDLFELTEALERHFN